MLTTGGEIVVKLSGLGTFAILKILTMLIAHLPKN